MGREQKSGKGPGEMNGCRLEAEENKRGDEGIMESRGIEVLNP